MGTRGLPNSIVVVFVIYESRETSIWVNLEEFRRLVLISLRVDVLGLVVKPELVKEVCGFPV